MHKNDRTVDLLTTGIEARETDIALNRLPWLLVACKLPLSQLISLFITPPPPPPTLSLIVSAFESEVSEEVVGFMNFKYIYALPFQYTFSY